MEEEAKQMQAATQNAQQDAQQGAQQTNPPALPQASLSALKAEKDALLDAAKLLNSQIFDLRAQIAQSVAQLRQASLAPSSRLRSQIDAIEFEIATSAFTPKQEKALISSKKVLEAQLSASAAADALQQKTNALRAQLKGLSEKRKEMDLRLDSLRASMAAEYAKSKQEYEKNKTAREKAAYDSLKARFGKKDASPQRNAPSGPRFSQSPRAGGRKDALDADEAKYLQTLPEFVSLEDVVVIEKKSAEKKDTEEQGAKQNEGTHQP